MTPDLPAIAGVDPHTGDDSILIAGLERITANIMRGHGIKGHVIDSHRRIIRRAYALEAALDAAMRARGMTEGSQ